jgi:hypothetical protein
MFSSMHVLNNDITPATYPNYIIHPIAKKNPTLVTAGTILTYLLTYSMEQSPSWAANRFVSSQENPRVLLNRKVHFRIQNCAPPVSILSQPNPVHTPTSRFCWYYSVTITLHSLKLYICKQKRSTDRKGKKMNKFVRNMYVLP